MSNFFIAMGSRGDPAETHAEVLQAMSRQLEGGDHVSAVRRPTHLILRPLGSCWRLEARRGGRDIHTGDLYRVTTATAVADVHLAAAARVLRVVHTRTTNPQWRRSGEIWVADVE